MLIAAFIIAILVFIGGVVVDVRHPLPPPTTWVVPATFPLLSVIVVAAVSTAVQRAAG